MYSEYLKYIDGTALQEVETFVKETGEGLEYEDFGKVRERGRGGRGRGGREGGKGGRGRGGEKRERSIRHQCYHYPINDELTLF